MGCFPHFSLLKMKALTIIVLITSTHVNAIVDGISSKSYDLSNYHNYSKSDTSSAYFTTSKIPLVWKKSSHVLRTGHNYVTLTLNITSPCTVLSQMNVSKEFQNQKNDRVSLCNSKFQNMMSAFSDCQLVEKPKLFIRNPVLVKHQKTRQPRFVTGVIAIATAITSVVALGISASNQFKVHQLHNEIHSLETKFEQQVKQLKELNHINSEILKDMEMELKKLNMKVSKIDDIEKGLQNFENFKLVEREVINHIRDNEIRLKNFIREFKKGHISSDFTDLFPNINLCPGHRCTSIDYFSANQCERTVDGLIILKIDAVLTDPQQEVYEAVPFTFFLPKPNDPEKVCVFDFIGVRYVLQNKNSNCANPLVTFHPTQEKEVVSVFDHTLCTPPKTQNSVQEFKENYKIEKCENITTISKYAQLKYTAKHLAVYCNEMLMILPTQKITINCSNLVYFVPRHTTISLHDPFSGTTYTYPEYFTHINADSVFIPDSQLVELINRQINYPKLNGEDVHDFSHMNKLMNEYDEKLKTLGESIFSSWTELNLSKDYGIIIGISIGIFIVILFLVVCCLCCKGKWIRNNGFCQKTKMQTNTGGSDQTELKGLLFK